MLVANKKECNGSEILFDIFNQDAKKSISDCANECRDKASMFIFGTNEFGNDRCSENGCSCSCETSAAQDGTCNMVSHDGYQLYKFMEQGRYLLWNMNLNIYLILDLW